MDTVVKRIIISLLATIILFGGITIFIVTNSIVISIFLVIMCSLIIWQYFELQKDRKALEILVEIEKELDKIIGENSGRS